MWGHNSDGAVISFTVKVFNSLAHKADGGAAGTAVNLPAGATIHDLCKHLQLSTHEVFLALVNGRDVSSGLVGAPICTDHVIQEGDVVALSGPVPYSWGYGSAVV